MGGENDEGRESWGAEVVMKATCGTKLREEDIDRRTEDGRKETKRGKYEGIARRLLYRAYY